jgi:outer membrane protein assembly factor BamB
LNAKEIQDRPFTTFPELGGDSMMAINASHLILSDIRKIGYKLSDDQKITPIDIMQLPLQALLEILENGRKALPPEAKKQRITGNSNDEGNIENLSSHAIAYSYNICTQDDSSLTISKNWKMPLKMCVDSRSLVINKGDDNVIISGSQGGDLACICSSGKLLSRTNVTGKIEGDLNFLAASLQTDMDPIIFVPTYVSSHDQAGTSTSGNEGKPGTGNIHALKLSKSNSLIPIWTYNTNGDIKSKPMIFTYPNSYKTNTHRLLTASYDGSLSYLDAITGELLQKKDGLGGAIHADPIVLTHESPNTDNTDATVSAIVASCTWKGKVTCLTLTQTSMEIKWEVDLWTPIYASPYVNPSRCKKDTPSVILCGIDGSVRSLNCNNGEEIWKTETGTKPIFTKCCRIDPSSEANTGQIILGSNDGKLRCIHESNGVIQWTINVHAPILSSPICSMDHIICATTAGSVLVFDKVPLRILVSTDIDGTCTSDRKQPGKDKTKYISAQANVPTEALTSVRLEGEIFSSPVAKGNDIYIGCRDSCLYKLTLDNK